MSIIDNIKKYSVESLVILFSIILSFYIEGRRDLAEKNSNKNKLITDLINTIDEDQKQLDYIRIIQLKRLYNTEMLKIKST